MNVGPITTLLRTLAVCGALLALCFASSPPAHSTTPTDETATRQQLDIASFQSEFMEQEYSSSFAAAESFCLTDPRASVPEDLRQHFDLALRDVSVDTLQSVFDKHGELKPGEDLTELERRRFSIYRLSDGSVYDISTFMTNAGLSMKKRGALAQTSLQRLPEWSTQAGVDRWAQLGTEERFTTFASVLDPVTGRAWQSFDDSQWKSMGVLIEVVPEAEWESFDPGVKDRIRVGLVSNEIKPGAGDPVEFMLHYKFYGDAPGRVLLERVLEF